jgi:hypothetical protein
MSNVLMPIDSLVLQTVTGGYKSSGDALLNDLSSLASSIKDLSSQTSGMSSTQMLLLCCLAMRNQQSQSNVLYVARGSRCW